MSGNSKEKIRAEVNWQYSPLARKFCLGDEKLSDMPGHPKKGGYNKTPYSFWFTGERAEVEAFYAWLKENIDLNMDITNQNWFKTIQALEKQAKENYPSFSDFHSWLE